MPCMLTSAARTLSICLEAATPELTRASLSTSRNGIMLVVLDFSHSHPFAVHSGYNIAQLHFTWSSMAPREKTSFQVRLSCHDLQANLGGQGVCRALQSLATDGEARLSPMQIRRMDTLASPLAVASALCFAMLWYNGPSVTQDERIAVVVLHTLLHRGLTSARSSTRASAQYKLCLCSLIICFFGAAGRSAIAQPRDVLSQVHLLSTTHPQLDNQNCAPVLALEFAHFDTDTYLRTTPARAATCSSIIQRSSNG
jgi:hypothetical protein